MLDSVEIFQLRKKLYDEIKKLPQCEHGGPETKDFEIVKKEVISHIAYKIWEKIGKPKNDDMAIWLEAENTWNFIRYAWY